MPHYNIQIQASEDHTTGPIEIEANLFPSERNQIDTQLRQLFDANVIYDYGIDEAQGLNYNELVRRIAEIAGRKRR